MDLQVKLEAFDGPLDLLLHLIEKNKVDIFDIPIVLITEQYLDYVSNMDTKDMDVMSEFLVMAATLVRIKSKMLLPAEEIEEEEEEDPRQELVERLLEYKMYKYMSYELRDRQMDAEHMLYRDPSIPKEVQQYKPPVNLDEILGDLNLEKLNAIFQDVMKRSENRLDPVRSKFGQVEKEEVDLDQTIAYVEKYISRHRKCNFSDLLNKQKSKMRIAITFLTILEMMKTGKIEVEQDEIFGEILITAKQSEE